MNDQQLTERLTRAADTLPPPAGTAIGEVQRRASAHRRHRHLRRSAAGLAIVAGVAASVPSLTPSGGSPEIAPMTQRPENGSSPQTPPGETDDPRRTEDQGDVTMQRGEAQEQRAPQADQLDAEVEFEVYAIVAPDGWQHVDSGVRTISPEAWTWVDTRWTPSGGAGGGEGDARLDLRQTDVATLSDGSMPVHADADRIEIQPGLPAYLSTERLPSGIEHHLLEWRQGDTYLELSGQGLTANELIDAAATAEPTPTE